jgi:para-nitrobenzyl esterase
VDLLIGTTAEEFRLFLVPSGMLDLVDDSALAMAAGGYGLTPAQVDVYRKTRPAASPGEILLAVGTDWFFRVPALRVAEARFGGPGRTFMYEFTWGSPAFDGRLGACHAIEIPFVFDDLGDDAVRGMLGPEPPQDLATEVHAAWVRFIAGGDPGWPAYDAARRQTMRLGPGGGLMDDPRSDERQVWEGLR